MTLIEIIKIKQHLSKGMLDLIILRILSKNNKMRSKRIKT